MEGIIHLNLSSHAFSLIDWISDTRSQGYTDLQSLVKCLDHRGIVLVLDTVCSQAKVVLGCAMHSYAFCSTVLQFYSCFIMRGINASRSVGLGSWRHLIVMAAGLTTFGRDQYAKSPIDRLTD